MGVAVGGCVCLGQISDLEVKKMPLKISKLFPLSTETKSMAADLLEMYFI